MVSWSFGIHHKLRRGARRLFHKARQRVFRALLHWGLLLRLHGRRLLPPAVQCGCPPAAVCTPGAAAAGADGAGTPAGAAVRG